MSDDRRMAHEMAAIAMELLEAGVSDTFDKYRSHTKAALLDEVEIVSNILTFAPDIHQEMLDDNLVHLAAKFHTTWMRIQVMLDQLEAYCAEIS